MVDNQRWNLEVHGEGPPRKTCHGPGCCCAGKGDVLVRYATDNPPNKVLVREYLAGPARQKCLAAEIAAARRSLENRAAKR